MKEGFKKFTQREQFRYYCKKK